MELKASWYDNLIAGGLFWLPQLYWVFRFAPSVFPTLVNFIEYLKGLSSEPVAALLITVIVALVTLVLLVTGNILEVLMGSGLAYLEIEVFHRHFVLNKHWVQKALKKHISYIQADYDSLDDMFKHSKLVPIAEPTFVQTSQFGDRWRQRWDWLTSGIRATRIALPAFNRLYALMLVRTLSKSGDEQSEIIVGPLQALRLTRLLSITFLIFLVDGLLIVSSEMSAGRATTQLMVIYVLSFVFEIIGLSFITMSFDRVCLILFPLWYDVEMKEEQNSEPAQNAKGEAEKVMGNNTRKKVKQAEPKLSKGGGRRS